MRRAEKPFIGGDYKIDHYKATGRWRVYCYVVSRSGIGGWDFDQSFRWRWEARRNVRKRIKEANRLPKAPEYWRA